MSRRVIIIAVALILWVLIGALGYFVAKWAAALLGAQATMIGACIVATLAVISLLGQYLTGTSDYFLSIENPRPLDEEESIITILGWGFASQSSRSCTQQLVGQGFADVRLFATRLQFLQSLATFGFARPVSIAWRGNAGQHPLGQA